MIPKQRKMWKIQRRVFLLMFSLYFVNRLWNDSSLLMEPNRCTRGVITRKASPWRDAKLRENLTWTPELISFGTCGDGCYSAYVQLLNHFYASRFTDYDYPLLHSQHTLYLLNLSRSVLEEIKRFDIPVYVCALLKPSSRLITRPMTSKHTASTRSTKQHTCIEVAHHGM